MDANSLGELIDNRAFFAACIEGNLVGCASVVEYGIAELRSLAIDPWYQSQGIGSALIEKCKEEAKLKGYGELYALVQDASRSVFEKKGFVYAETPPEKLNRDCAICPQYGNGCREYAVVASLRKEV